MEMPPDVEPLLQRQRAMGKPEDGDGQSTGNEHVHVGELSGEKVQRLQQQRCHRDSRRSLIEPFPAEQVNRCSARRTSDEWCKPGRPFIRTHGAHAQRREPIEKGRLVEVRQAVERRRQPFA